MQDMEPAPWVETLMPLPVLHVIARLPVGGVEQQLLTVVKHYDRERFTPLVCSLSDKGPIGAEIESAGIEVISLGSLRHTFSWATVTALARVMSERRVAVVRTHQYHANLYGRLAAIGARVPCVVASVHNAYTRDRKLHRRMINYILSRFTDRVVAVSESVRHDVMKYDHLPGDKVIVIRNGIDVEAFQSRERSAVRSEFGIADGVPVVGTVGRLTPQKGHHSLIEAFARLAPDFPAAVLMVVGEGPLKEDLQGYAGRLGVADRVIFTGLRRDIPQLLAAMDVFVLPSLWEGMPNALIEAMASGKAAITTDFAFAREIVNSDRLGILVPPQDSNAIARSVASLLRDATRSKRLGEAARENVRLQFSITRTVDTYCSLFIEIMGQKGINPVAR